MSYVYFNFKSNNPQLPNISENPQIGKSSIKLCNIGDYCIFLMSSSFFGFMVKQPFSFCVPI